MPVVLRKIFRKPRLKLAISLFLAVLGLMFFPAAGLRADPPTAWDLIEICESGTAEELSEALARGGDADTGDSLGNTLLMYVAKDESGAAARKAEILLAAGVDPNLGNGNNTTALHDAVRSGDLDLVKTLLAAGADAKAVDDGGNTVLIVAGIKDERWPEGRQEALFTLLLAAGATVEPGLNLDTGQPTDPPLHGAAMYSGPEAVGMLLEAGARVNALGRCQTTALMWAAGYNSSPETVALLLKAGADATLRNCDGQTALDYVRENQTPAAAEIYTMMEAALKSGSPD